MKTSQITLFALRAFFYFSVIVLILVHPAITVPYDSVGLIQWFVIIPLGALIAFIPFPAFSRKKHIAADKSNLTAYIVAVSLLFPLSIIAGGFGFGALEPFAAGILSFVFTLLLFHYPRWAKIAMLEPFFLSGICLRLLAFSRSSEEMAGESTGLTQFIFVWSMAVFLLHSVIVYFCLYPQSRKGATREVAVFSLATAAALLAALIILPTDFVRNSIVENLIPDRVTQRIGSDDFGGVPLGGRRDGRRTLPRDGSGRRPELRGLSESVWGQGMGSRRGEGDGGNGGESRQYMIKVVATKQEPLYMGDSFRGKLDPVEGFLPTPDENLNRLPSQRFFVTWTDNERVYYRGRTRQEIFSLSTLSQKYLPYRPVSIDPTILNEGSGPLRFIHNIVSNTYSGDPLMLVRTQTRSLNNLSNAERNRLAPYLEINLTDEDRILFTDYLNGILSDWQSNRTEIIQSDRYLSALFGAAANRTVNPMMETLLAILISFSTYQYDLNNADDFSVDNLRDFLFFTKEGDCVEFGHALALLGRLAGIPSRLVTGYLVAESLQTPAHLQGLAVLRNKIPALQEFEFEDLYLVTNLHAHAWPQFYIPDYGWLDFEATAFAIPPVGSMDFNTWDVVIPLMDDTQLFSQVRAFPWQAVLRSLAVVFISLAFCAYSLRYGREAFLYYRAQSGGREGARSLYLLLLSKLAADGKAIKPVSKTALEYSALFGTPFEGFAKIYTELRWRECSAEEQNERFSLLKEEYRKILDTTRDKGAKAFIIRLFSLRGLNYL